ncbi:hypothetical protein HDV63DRAFT_400331 [Trichoderma sp. SZMC 28014]
MSCRGRDPGAETRPIHTRRLQVTPRWTQAEAPVVSISSPPRTFPSPWLSSSGPRWIPILSCERHSQLWSTLYYLAVGLKLSKFADVSTRGVEERLVLHPPADELGRAGKGAALQLSQLTMAIGCCVFDPKEGIGNPNSIETGLAAGHAPAAKLN